jgi:hypothetical protein
MLAFRGIDGKRPDDRLCHLHLYVSITIAHGNRPVRLVKNDVLHPFFVEG